MASSACRVTARSRCGDPHLRLSALCPLGFMPRDSFKGAGPCALAAAAKPPEAAQREGGALAAGRVNTVLRIHGVFARRGWGGAEEGSGRVAW